MKRLLMNADVTGGLEFSEAKRPQPQTHQSLVKVTAFSLNRGELSFAQDPNSKGRTIGWDYVGVVEEPTVNGSGHQEGTRVVGWRPQMDAFSEYVIGDPDYMAVIPDAISDVQAATLPVAGLTALAAVDKGDRILGHSALVTGVTGGVGFFALQLAKLSGARTVAGVRRSEQKAFAKDIGADAVVVTTDMQELEAEGPYRLVVDGVGGDLMTSLLQVTDKGGKLVSYGVSQNKEAAIDLMHLFGNGGQRRIYGLTLYSEVEIESSSVALQRLLRLVEDGRLRLPVTTKADWAEAPNLASALLTRKISGKAVLVVR